MYKKLSTKVLLKHPRLTVEEDEIELENGQKSQYLRYGSGHNGVVIVARNADDQILFLHEYSYIPNRTLLQLPGGRIEDGEAVETAANRELQEEADYKATALKIAGYYFQHHRRNQSKAFAILASDLIVSKMDGESQEEITKVWIPIADIQSLVEKNEIVDSDTLASLRLAGL